MPVNELQTQWGHRLRSARRSAGLSLSEAARRAEIDKGQLSRAEAGAVGLGDDARIRIALVYERPVAELFPYPDTTDTTDQETPCPSAASASDGDASPTPATTAARRSTAPSAAAPAVSASEGSRDHDRSSALR